jgi:hypothetical protein
LIWGKIAVDEKGAVVEKPVCPASACRELRGQRCENRSRARYKPSFAGRLFGRCVVADRTRHLRVPVSYTVQPLQLRVEPPELDFGTIWWANAPRAAFASCATTKFKGGGKPRGTIYSGESLGGLVAPPRFNGDQPLEITADGGMPDAIAKSYEGALQLDTNGGRLRVPVRYAFVLPPVRWLVLVLSAAFAGGSGSGCVARLIRRYQSGLCVALAQRKRAHRVA